MKLSARSLRYPYHYNVSTTTTTSLRVKPAAVIARRVRARTQVQLTITAEWETIAGSGRVWPAIARAVDVSRMAKSARCCVRVCKGHIWMNAWYWCEWDARNMCVYTYVYIARGWCERTPSCTINDRGVRARASAACTRPNRVQLMQLASTRTGWLRFFFLYKKRTTNSLLAMFVWEYRRMIWFFLPVIFYFFFKLRFFFSSESIFFRKTRAAEARTAVVHWTSGDEQRGPVEYVFFLGEINKKYVIWNFYKFFYLKWIFF